MMLIIVLVLTLLFTTIPPRSLTRWLAVGSLLVAGGGLIAFIRRRLQQQAVSDQHPTINSEFQVPSPTFEDSETETSHLERNLQTSPPEIQDLEISSSSVLKIDSSTPSARPAPLRILGFLALAVIVAVVLIGLQNQSSLIAAPIFILLLIGSVTLAAWNAPDASERSVRGLVATVQQAFRVFLEFRQGTRRRIGLASVFTGFAVLVMAYSAFQFYQAVAGQLFPRAALQWLLIGVVFMGAAMFFNRSAVPIFAAVPPTSLHTSTTMRRRATLAGVIALLILTEINSNLFGLALEAHYLVQFGLLLIGIVLLLIGLGGQEWRLPHLSKQETLLLIGLTLLAFLPRVIGLETVIHRFVDEIHYAGAVARLQDVPFTRILTPFAEVTAFTWMYPILQTGSVGLFGLGLGALRLPSAIFGALTIPAVYFLARTLFDRRAALFAALLLATFPPHVHFSRLALNNIADPFFGTLALAFLFRGLKWGRRSDYVIAGVMLGLTQYFYEGGRLLYPPLLVTVFGISWLLLKRGRAHLAHAVVGLLVAVLIAAPFYVTLIESGQTIIPRMNQEGISETEWNKVVNNYDSPDRVYQRFVYPFLMYIGVVDLSWFYGGYEPIVLRYFVPAFLLGLAVLIWRWRLLGALALIIWLLATSAGNIFIRDSAWTPRYIVAFPAVVLLMALGLRHALPLIWPSEFRPKVRQWAVAALLVVMVGGQTVYYFGDHLAIFDRQFRRTSDVEDALFRAQELPTGTHVFIIVPYAVWLYNLGIWRDFFNMNVLLESRYPVEVDAAFLDALPNDTNYAFFIEQSDAETLAELQERFHLLPPELSPYNIPIANQLVLYVAPRIQQQ